MINALILIDDNPLRSQASREFKKIYEKYTRHVAEIRYHEEQVRPSYYRWFAALFGDRLEKVQKLQHELERKSALLRRLRELCIFEGFDRDEVLDFAQEEMAQEEMDAQSRQDGSSGAEEDTWGPEYERIFEEFARVFSREIDADRQRDQTDETDLGIKTYYRKLAQALHPDLAGDLSETTRELWDETQTAYKNGDLEQLRLLWTLVTLRTDAFSREVRVSELNTAVEHMKQKLDEVKSQKRRLLREDPSWGFNRKNKQELATQIRSDLEHDEYAIASALEDIEEDLRIFS